MSFNKLTNKRILVGITGGIAAYKTADLVRRLREQGVEVRVVMTQASMEFITPLTMQAVSGKPVHSDLLDPAAEGAMGHIKLARWADLILIAPASANFMARLAMGQADDLLSTLCLATRAPLALAPAMNQQMWQDEATQQNVHTLAKRGIYFLGPGDGAQACGEIGPGRMLEPMEIIEKVTNCFTTKLLTGKHVVITAGPTQENIDPVRYISNRSSGKMGYALAQAAVEADAIVTLISGPVHLPQPDRVKQIHVTSAMDMYEAAMKEAKVCDIFIATAAVADYRCQQVAPQKLSKQQAELTLTLIRNPDIVAEVAALPKAPFTVGFAAETEQLEQHALAKLQRKRLDMIVANQVGTAHTGFESETNAVTLLWDKQKKVLPLASKSQLGKELIQIIAEIFHAKHST